jgi:adenylate cyclase
MVDEKKTSVSITDRMVLAGIGFAAVYWIIETFIYVIFSYEIDFFERLFGPDLSGVCTRLIALCLFVIFGAHAQYTINERKKAFDELAQYRTQFDEILAQRTSELKNANEQLQEEIESLKQQSS